MKQAVVVVHGMGDQIPMSTINGFVEAVWETDDNLVAGDRIGSTTGEISDVNEVWSKPDDRNRSYELRRLTTQQDKNKKRTDFFEFYWAHHVQGTTWEQVKSWILDLLIRSPRRVPSHVKGPWLAMWALAVVMVASFLWASYLGLQPDAEGHPIWNAIKPVLPLVSLLVSGGVAALVSNVFVKRVGDVVRYTSARPQNVAIRQKIREAGVELLEELNSDRKYDRVIVVAHSLGAIVAYDVLTHAFSRCNETLNFDKVYKANLAAATKKGVKEEDFEFTHQPALRTVEDIVNDVASKARAGEEASLDVEVYRAAQRAAQRELVQYECPWRVTDFFTLGSPLAHAEFLVTDGIVDLRKAQVKRRLPTCPPVQEYKGGRDKGFFLAFTTPSLKRRPGAPRIPHHGTMFAFTRWTNIYSPRRWVVGGDIVSGPAGRVFGLPVRETGSDKIHEISGIQEHAVLPERDASGKVLEGHRIPLVTHNSYWNLKAETGAPEVTEKVPHHIQVLRNALNLLEK